MFQNGISVVLTGCPNVGKSSLMNALVEYERVIVTQVSGTTRDVVEETISVQGIPVRLADTAGLIQSSCEITQASVSRSLQFCEKADVVLLVLDATSPAVAAETEVARRLQKKKVVVVLNKIDLKKQRRLAHVRRLLPDAPVISTSAYTGTGVAMLKQSIADKFLSGDITRDNQVLIGTMRQKELLIRCREGLQRARGLIREHRYDECLAFEIRQALEDLNELVGADVSEDVLAAIFSRFCIGK